MLYCFYSKQVCVWAPLAADIGYAKKKRKRKFAEMRGIYVSVYRGLPDRD